jgi:IS1 family transposase
MGTGRSPARRHQHSPGLAQQQSLQIVSTTFPRIQCDEIWSFVGAKQKNVAGSKRAGDPTAGDCWTWTALEAETKLLISYQVGGRDAEYALMLMDDLRGRLVNRVQLTTDGHKAYLQAVEEAFGADIDYGMLVKLYGAETGGQGHERKYRVGHVDPGS